MAESSERRGAPSTGTSVLPLAGVRVLEFSQAIAGPTCGRYFAAFGAEVIKIESWRNPDVIRLIGSGWLPRETDMRVAADTGPMVGDYNAGKLSAGLNTSAPEARDIILRLAARCDVLLSNLAAPVLPSLGLGYEDVRAVKPDIIYLSLPGFGNTPSRYYDFRAWGPNQAPLTSLDYLTGWPDRPPSGIGSFSYPDYTNGGHAMVVLMAALLYRDRTGEGQFIDMSQYEGTIACAAAAIMDYTTNGRIQSRTGSRLGWAAPHGIYPARGTERWVALACLTDEHWAALCDLAGDAPFTTDSRFATMDGRLTNVEELDAAIAAWTPAFTAQELATRLQERGVPAGIVADQADLAVDPQLEARRWWQLVPHPRFGRDLVHGIIVQLSDTPASFERGVPGLGEHNTYVLEQLAGLSPEEHRELAQKGVVFDFFQPEARFRRPYIEWLRYLIRNDRWPNPDEPIAAPTAATTTEPVAPVSGAEAAPSGVTDPSAGPLAGLRVLDLTDAIGCYGTKLLADLGADVIRIEPPEGSDLRAHPPFLHDVPGRERSLAFAYMNTSKRSVTLDLSQPDGQALFDELAATADIVYYSGDAAGYDALDLEGLRARHPRLVVTAVTPFGLTGPFRDWSGNDLIAWATGGLAFTLGDPDRPPVIPGPNVELSYFLASLFAAFGALVAVRGRDRLGHGQRADISLQECVVMACIEAGVTGFVDDLIPRRRAGSRRAMTAPWGHYETTDGAVSVLAIMPSHWDALSQWIYETTGNEAVIDPALKGGALNRSGDASLVVNMFTEEFTRQFTRQELFEEGQRRGIPITPVNDPASVADDPQLVERDFWTTIEVDGETVRAPGAPYRPALTPWAIRRQPPRLGQHNAEIYGELGLSAERIVALRGAKVI